MHTHCTKTLKSQRYDRNCLQYSRFHSLCASGCHVITLSLRCTASPFLFQIAHFPKRLNGLTHSHGRYCYALGRQDPTIAMFDEIGTARINSSLTHTAAASTKQRSHRRCRKFGNTKPTPEQPAPQRGHQMQTRKAKNSGRVGVATEKAPETKCCG